MLRRVHVACLVLCLGLLGALAAQADDVPDDVRKWYDKARTQVASGDLKKAFSSLSKARSKNPDSVDFWMLYVKVYRGLDKKETVLWDKIIAKVEAKHPQSTTFHMLRYKLASEAEERIEHLKKATEVKPDDVGPWLLLAREYLKIEDEVEAEDILDRVLEKNPGNEEALVTKGDLMIESGFSRSAVDFAEESLAEHDLPGLHDLAARANLIVAENDEEAMAKAEEHAKKAVEGRPDPAFVVTYATVLDRMGKLDEAVALLSDNLAKSNSPVVAGRLGELAFRSGDYGKAVKGLTEAAGDDLNASIALALSHARLGNAKAARGAVKTMLGHDADRKIDAASVEVLLGDFGKSLAHLEGLDGEDAAFFRMALLARQGKAAEAAAIGAEHAKSGDRVAEEWLVEMAIGHITAKLGGKGKAAWKTLTEGRWAAAKAGTATATPPEFEPNLLAKSFGFMQRMASYRRALDGSFFSPQQMFIAPTQIDGVAAVGVGVIAASECARDPGRVFPFNAKKIEGENVTVNLADVPEVWEAAESAFKEGCAALASGDAAKADTAFGKALEQEATWGRAMLLQAAAKVMAGGDVAAAAKLAKDAAGIMIDDWEGRALGVLIRIAAGETPTAEIKALSEREESFSTRLFEEL